MSGRKKGGSYLNMHSAPSHEGGPRRYRGDTIFPRELSPEELRTVLGLLLDHVGQEVFVESCGFWGADLALRPKKDRDE